ncbi:unnamed protein product [Wuchereria bancrofti]|uniref:Uncharacterized protein n=2 Tax=Wuchereria bancrofti TaxID=6293 RepID=A0A3P7EQQ1_WUCBA|nr:unnamed protein product [Wuchereria bancrofti]
MEDANLREESGSTAVVDSIHSDVNNTGTQSRSASRIHLPIILDISDNQQTVKEVSPSKRLSVLGIFNHNHGDC